LYFHCYLQRNAAAQQFVSVFAIERSHGRAARQQRSARIYNAGPLWALLSSSGQNTQTADIRPEQSAKFGFTNTRPEFVNSTNK
jgi:hypothetical protein